MTYTNSQITRTQTEIDQDFYFGKEIEDLFGIDSSLSEDSTIDYFPQDSSQGDSLSNNKRFAHEKVKSSKINVSKDKYLVEYVGYDGNNKRWINFDSKRIFACDGDMNPSQISKSLLPNHGDEDLASKKPLKFPIKRNIIIDNETPSRCFKTEGSQRPNKINNIKKATKKKINKQKIKNKIWKDEIDWMSIKTDRQREISGESTIVSTSGIVIGQKLNIMDSNKDFYEGIAIAQYEGKILVSYPQFGPEYSEWIDSHSKRIKTLKKVDEDGNLHNLGSFNTPSNETKIMIVKLLKDYQSYIESVENSKKSCKSNRIISKKKINNSKAKSSVVQQKGMLKENEYSGQSSEGVCPNSDTEKSSSDFSLDYNSDQSISYSSGSDTIRYKRYPKLKANCFYEEPYFYPGRKHRDLTSPIPPDSCKPLSTGVVGEDYFSIPQQLKLSSYLPYFFPGLDIAVRGNNASVWWPSRVTKIVKNKIYIEYDGWPSDYDEKIDVNSTRISINRDSHAKLLASNALRISPTKKDKQVKKDICKQMKQPLSLRLAVKQVKGMELDQKNLLNIFYPQNAGTIDLPHKEMSISDYKFFYKIGDQVKAQITEKNYYKAFGDEIQPTNADLWQFGLISGISGGHISVEFSDLSKSSYANKISYSDDNSLDTSVLGNAHSHSMNVSFREKYPFNSLKVKVLSKTINEDGRVSSIGILNKKSKPSQTKKNTVLESFLYSGY
ncbi:hypothetical protein AYI68_g3937 [Smittium mucronatum]|uniref:Tudor domain-containing protein n=1 Tax=Smittium mucronatum TaxID=133383 RepID=A0A1R0GYH7_9FUNG|nr:hypothetical protein AYI68_g3937 [Smittium mucronatum]